MIIPTRDNVVKHFIIDPPLWFIFFFYLVISGFLYQTFGEYLVGVLFWQVWEYAIHRWLFHGPLVKHHRIHHLNPATHVALPLPFSVGGAIVLAVVFPFAILSGILAGYVNYEFAHRAELPWHLIHHRDASRMFGVNTPIFDFIFRTF